jgi:CubicO group peptidase (beta-lactamase class C family)
MVVGEVERSPLPGVTLDNWQTASRLHWSFQHIEELFPTEVISRGHGEVADLPATAMPVEEFIVRQHDGSCLTVADIMAATDTDGWIVARHGRVLAEHYPQRMPPQTMHILMSVSKSLVGTVAGALIAAGELDPLREISAYIPAIAQSGYAGATVRHLLDMRSGIRFSEEYLDPQAEVRLLEQAIGWAPRTNPMLPRNMCDYLLSLRQKSAHGGPFEYRSGESDVLGWVCEAAAGERMHRLMSELLWSKLGAQYDAVIGVDSEGTGAFDGGICAALRDMVRFGTMIAQDGTSMTGKQVVPPWWVEDTARGDADSRAAFAASPSITLMPGGMYRNQFWLPFPGGDVILCLGIHGQMIYIDRVSRVVGAKLSSWPEPQHAWKLFSTLRAFATIAAQVSA